MPDQICLSEEQQDELVHALVEERMHLLLVGGAAADQAALLHSLENRLRPTLSLVREGSELQALLHVKQWLSQMHLSPPAPETEGWCAPAGPQDEPRFAMVLSSPAPNQVERGRQALGPNTQFLLTLPHDPDRQTHAALLRSLEQRVVEIQLDPRSATPSHPHRLEAVLVGLILVLVGLSTLWLAESAVSESPQKNAPTSGWSMRP